MSQRKIIQITPATGWSAVFKAEGKYVSLITEPLACWAMIEETGDDGKITSKIEGLVGIKSVEFVTDSTSFIGYIGPGQTTDKLRNAG
jgi:hypothetical protein